MQNSFRVRLFQLLNVNCKILYNNGRPFFSVKYLCQHFNWELSVLLRFHSNNKSGPESIEYHDAGFNPVQKQRLKRLESNLIIKTHIRNA